MRIYLAFAVSLLFCVILTEKSLAKPPMVLVEIAMVERAMPPTTANPIETELKEFLATHSDPEFSLAGTLARWKPQQTSPLPARFNVVRVKLRLDAEIEVTSSEFYVPGIPDPPELKNMELLKILDGIDVRLKVQQANEGKLLLKSHFSRRVRLELPPKKEGEPDAVPGIATLGITPELLLTPDEPYVMGGLLTSMEHQGEPLTTKAVFIFRAHLIERAASLRP
ncbi:hypothetical protein [Bremerella cremea]|uniref:hypothetical protein n=1 Tax=Bremerella cremea TaxID=1031537 RepID=UPI0031F0A49F